MAWGMKHVPERVSMNPVLYIHAMANPFVALGVFALALSLLTRMALFSLADLSFVLPVTAIGYVYCCANCDVPNPQPGYRLRRALHVEPKYTGPILEEVSGLEGPRLSTGGR